MSEPDTKEASLKDDTISLLDLIGVLVKHRWFIIVSTVLAGGMIVLYALYTLRAEPDAQFNFLPNVYLPEVKVRLQEGDKSSIQSYLAGSELGLLASLSSGGEGSSAADLAQELLFGNTILDQLAERYNLIERFNIKKYPKTMARARLRGSFETAFSQTTGILTIRFESTDKAFATEILNTALEELEKRFKELTMLTVITKKRFLEDSISKYEKEMLREQQRLIDFQTENKIIDIDLQAQSLLSSLSGVEGSILTKEAELNGLIAVRRPEDPEIRKLKMEIALLKDQREMIRAGFPENDGSLDIPQKELPGLAATYFNLTRNLSIIQAIYGELRQQFETARIEESDDSRKFEIIEWAEIPEIKSGPSRGRICIIITLAAFFLSVILSFAIEYFARVERDPVEADKLAAIRSMLRLFPKKK